MQRQNNSDKNELFELFGEWWRIQKGYGSRLVFRKGCEIREIEERAKNVFRVPVGNVYS